MEPSDLLFSGRLFRVVRHVRVGPDGREHVRQIVRHPGAVAILPLVDEDHVCLLKNFRAAVEQHLVELPAGTLEPGEDPARAAARELIEETGYRAAKIELLTDFYTSPGILDERMYLYLATGLEPGPQALDPGEEIQTWIVTFSEAMDLIRQGRIRDAKTLAGLLYYEHFFRRKTP